MYGYNKLIEMPQNRIEEKQYGFEFTLMDGWQSRRMQTGYIFGHPDYKGLMLMLYHNSKTLQAMKDDMYAGFYDDSGFNIQVEGEVKEINEQMILANYSGTADGKPALGFGIALLSPFGGGVLICSISNPEMFNDDYMDMVEDIAKSVSFFEPQPQDLSQQWTRFLSGLRLVKIGDQPGKSLPVIELFENGSFFHGNANDRDDEVNNNISGRGNWEVIIVMEQPILRMKFFDSTEKQFNLEYDEDLLYLNQEPWKISRSDEF